jgi:ABC-2 type transport system permease protein
LTPFPYGVYFPAANLAGFDVPIGPSLAVIAFWLTVFFLANRWLWRRALKQYSGMGA